MYSSNNSYKKCTILLKEPTYIRLKNKGRFGESFSELVSRLLDEIDYIENKNKGEKNKIDK
jgi:hypothetical protein